MAEGGGDLPAVTWFRQFLCSEPIWAGHPMEGGGERGGGNQPAQEVLP